VNRVMRLPIQETMSLKKVAQIYIMISAPKGWLNRWSFVVWLVGYTSESSVRKWSTEFSRKQEE